MASRQRPSRSLPRGRHALRADVAAQAHRERLHAAAIGLLCGGGYEAMTVDAVAASAGVSTGALYGLYRGKEELVLAVWQDIVGDADQGLRVRPTPGGDGLRAALNGVLEAIMHRVIGQPDLAKVAVVEVLAVGVHGPRLRRRLVDAVQNLLAEATRGEAGQPQMSEVALAVVAGGTVQLIDEHLRSGRLRPLRAAAQDLAAWGTTYETDNPLPLPRAVALPYGGGRRPRAARALSLPHGRHGLPAGFVRRHQRGRILEAVMALAAEGGCENVTVRHLTAHAQLSNETFYKHFATRDEALRAAFDDAFVEVFARSWYAAAEQAQWPSEAAAAVTAWTQLIAAEPQLAHFALNQAWSGGPESAQQKQEAHRAFARLLDQDRERDAPSDLPALVPQALASGIAALAGRYVADNRAQEVAGLTDQLIYAVLTPYLGETQAREATGLDVAAEDEQTNARLRQQLMLAFAEVVREDGYATTRLVDVAQRTGIELDVAGRLFDDELDIATQCYDAWARPLVLAAAAGFLSGRGDPPLAAHRALSAALHYLSQHPALTTLAVTEAPDVLAAQAALREHYVELFFALIAGDAPAPTNTDPAPQTVLQMVVDGLLTVVRHYAEEDRLDELPDALGDLTRQVLTPFFGAEHAARVAAISVESEGARGRA